MDKEAIARELLAAECVDPDNAALLRTARKNSAAFEFMVIPVSTAIRTIVAALAKADAIIALQSTEGDAVDEAAYQAALPFMGVALDYDDIRGVSEAVTAAVLATLSPAEPSPLRREGIVEECAKEAEAEAARAQDHIAENYRVTHFGGVMSGAEAIASAIRALASPEQREARLSDKLEEL